MGYIKRKIILESCDYLSAVVQKVNLTLMLIENFTLDSLGEPKFVSVLIAICCIIFF